ncbi:ferric reductase-like transmembrane domain-containing protein [Rhodococcus aerolatus]
MSGVSSEALWALGRGAGVVLLVLMSTTVLLGLLTRSGRPAPGLPRFAVTLVHRNASLLAVVFLVVHIGTLYFDPYAQLSLVDAVVPFLGSYEPFWLGLGTLALDLTAAVVVTSLLRARLGPRAWKTVHWAAYALWPLAVAHSLGTGTDSGSAWFLVVLACCVVPVLAATAWRVSTGFTEHAHRRAGAAPDRRLDPTPSREVAHP